MTRTAFVTLLVGLTSAHDQQVKLEMVQPGPGSNQWPYVGFNAYTYSQLRDQSASGKRVLAQMDIMGQASVLLAKHPEVAGDIVPQTYHKTADGAVVASMRLCFRPNSTSGSTAEPQMDVNKELADMTTRFCALDGDISVLSSLPATPAIALGILRAAVAKLETRQSVDAGTEQPPDM